MFFFQMLSYLGALARLQDISSPDFANPCFHPGIFQTESWKFYHWKVRGVSCNVQILLLRLQDMEQFMIEKSGFGLHFFNFQSYL